MTVGRATLVASALFAGLVVTLVAAHVPHYAAMTLAWIGGCVYGITMAGIWVEISMWIVEWRGGQWEERRWM